MIMNQTEVHIVRYNVTIFSMQGLLCLPSCIIYHHVLRQYVGVFPFISSMLTYDVAGDLDLRLPKALTSLQLITDGRAVIRELLPKTEKGDLHFGG